MLDPPLPTGAESAPGRVSASRSAIDPYPCREPGSDNPHSRPDRSPRNPHPSPERVPAQEGGPLWHFRGFPLGLDVFPGMSGARRGLEAKRSTGNTRGHGGPVTADQADDREGRAGALNLPTESP